MTDNDATRPYLIKLVRDKMGDGRFTAPGIEYRPIEDHDEAIKLLRQKLGEEVAEFLVNPTMEELADVAEVVGSLARLDGSLGGRWAEGKLALSRAVTRKREERGGFDSLLGMYTTVLAEQDA